MNSSLLEKLAWAGIQPPPTPPDPRPRRTAVSSRLPGGRGPEPRARRAHRRRPAAANPRPSRRRTPLQVTMPPPPSPSSSPPPRSPLRPRSRSGPGRLATGAAAAAARGAGWFSDACASYTARMRLNRSSRSACSTTCSARGPTRTTWRTPSRWAAARGRDHRAAARSTRTPLSEGPRPTVASATGSSTRTPSAGRCSTRARCSTAGTRVTRWHGTPCCAGTRLLGT